MPSIEHDPRTLTNLRKVHVVYLECPFRHRPDVLCQAVFRNTQRASNVQVRARLAHHLAAGQQHAPLSQHYCFHAFCRNPVQPNQAAINAHVMEHDRLDAAMMAPNPDIPPLPYQCTLCDQPFGSQVEVNSHYRKHHHSGTFLCGYPGCEQVMGQQDAMCDHYVDEHLRPRPPRRRN